MKPQLRDRSAALHLACLFVGLAVRDLPAQNPAGLAIETYAGVTLTGAVGAVYILQSSTNPANPDGWRASGIVQLPSTPYLWMDTSASAAGHRFYRTMAGPTNLVWIPPGTFTMGSPSNEVESSEMERPQTVVTLTHGFFMGRYEVTQGEYLDIMGSNPSRFRNGTDGTNFGGTGGTITDELRHPVEDVAWEEAVEYCVRLAERERVGGRLPPGWVYRLPTEAEWEYACRGGTTSAFYHGPALRSGMANFPGTYEYDSSSGTAILSTGLYLGRTSVVGSYPPNGWGLYDMHGNVSEWCADWVVDFTGLAGGRVVDPLGSAPGTERVLRGGSWAVRAVYCRSAARFILDLEDRFIGQAGLRVVLAPGR